MERVEVHALRKLLFLQETKAFTVTALLPVPNPRFLLLSEVIFTGLSALMVASSSPGDPASPSLICCIRHHRGEERIEKDGSLIFAEEQIDFQYAVLTSCARQWLFAHDSLTSDALILF